MPIIPRFSLPLSYGDLSLILKSLPEGEKRRGAIEEFEHAFSLFIGAKHAFFVPSARLGLFLILKNMGLPERSRIILPAWTHLSVPAIVCAAGFEPLFVDIVDHTFNMSPGAIPEEFLSTASAIIPTHLYGCPCNMDEIMKLARAHNLKVIEDCAQGCGARFKDSMTGGIGDASYFSFSLTKNFTTMGGGMIATSDGELAEKLRVSLEARTPGLSVTGTLCKAIAFKMGTRPLIFALTLYPALRLFSLLGKDPLHTFFEEKISLSPPRVDALKLSEVQGILGLAQLKELTEKNRLRNIAGAYLIEKLQGLEGAKIPMIPEGAYHIFLSFVIKTENRRMVSRELLKRGVDTSPGYLKACYKAPGFEKYRQNCPVAEAAENEQLHLPIYPEMTRATLDHIVKSLKESLARLRLRPTSRWCNMIFP